MVYSTYIQQRILYFHFQGLRPYAITEALRHEEIATTKQGVRNLVKKYLLSGSILQRPGSGRPTKITMNIKRIVDSQMQLDDETTCFKYAISSVGNAGRSRQPLTVHCFSTSGPNTPSRTNLHIEY